MKSTSLLALALMAGLTTQAVAQGADPAPPSAEQAKVLEGQVRAWLADMSGGTLALPDGIVRFTPEERGYRITIPVGTLPQVEPKDAVVTARAHQLDATRWSIDAEELPPALKITTQQRVPDFPPPAAAPIPGSPPAPPRPVTTHLATVIYEVKLGARTASGVFDPSYATASNSQSTLASLDMVQTGGPAATILHFGPLTSVTSVTPSGDRRVDTLIDQSFQNYETKTAFPGGGPSLTVTMEQVHLLSAVAGLAVDKVPPLMRLLVAAGRIGDGKAPVGPSSKAIQHEHMHAILLGAIGLLSGGTLDQTMDKIVFDAGGHTGSVRRAVITFAGEAPQDNLTGSMGLTIDGLTVAELPPALAAYVPSHFVIHPTVSNLSISALTKIGLDASGPAGQAPEADYAALFQNGGINVGFDSFGLDVAGATFTGTGSFHMTGPQTVTGQAEISARGLDALVTRAQADPMLGSVAPVLIFLKGIAKTNADQSVWQVAVANGKALVNGIDLMAMLGGMGR